MRRRSTRDAIPRVKVRNLQKTVPIDVADLERFATKAVRCCVALRRRKPTDLTKLREIFILFISDRRMALLHRQFLNQPGPTDVLTFQHGEIFISIETARRHARAFGNSLTGELRLYIVHGLLHLDGFDDRERTDARKMERVQKRILAAATADR
jgi:probable rRNA maturation factor